MAGPTGPTGPTGATGGGATGLWNANLTNQSINATDNYLTGSNLAISGHIKLGSTMRWRMVAQKTAAGTAVPTFNVRFGTGGTVTDTARCVITGTAQTAASDTAHMTLEAVFRATGASSVVQSALEIRHSGTTAGIVNVTQGMGKVVTSTAFDVTPASTQVGLSINPGTAGVWNFILVTAEAENIT